MCVKDKLNNVNEICSMFDQLPKDMNNKPNSAVDVGQNWNLLMEEAQKHPMRNPPPHAPINTPPTPLPQVQFLIMR